MGPLSYVHFAACVAYLSLGMYVLSRNSRAAQNRYAAGIFAALATWSFGHSVVHNPFVSYDTVTLWGRVSAIGWTTFGPCFLGFVLAYTRRLNPKSNAVVWSLLGLSMIFLWLQWDNRLFVAYTHYWYGWEGTWRKALPTYLFFAFYLGTVMTGVVILGLHGRTASVRNIRINCYAIAISAIICLAIGTMLNVVGRMTALPSLPPLANLVALFWAATVVYAIAKHQFLGLGPQLAADTIVSSMSDLLFILDDQENVVVANNSATALLHYDDNTLIGSPFASLVDNAEPDPPWRSPGPVRDVVLRLKTGAGTHVPVSASFSPLPSRDGSALGVVCTARDLTFEQVARRATTKSREELEREVAERTRELITANDKLRRQADDLRSSEERFRVIFEYSPDGCYLSDLRGTFIDGNRRAEELTGYERSELIGKSFLNLKLLPTAEVARASGALALSIAGRPTGPEEYSIRRKDGDMVVLEISTFPVRIGGRKLVLGVARDVSARKRAEEEQREFEEQRRQSQKLDALGQLAGGIAHDFNNMLGAMMGYAQMIVQKAPDDRTDLKRYASRVSDAAHQSANLTAKLLAFARKGKFETARVDMHAVIGDVTSLLKHTIDKRIRIETRLQAEQSAVMGDHTQLENALLNLGLNARDAMPSGGTLTLATKVLAEQSGDGSDRLCIEVSDTGVGMDEATRRRIFEPFFTTKESGKGTGLGLASVYGTVEHHGGSVTVRSAPGKGACFEVLLPLSRDAAPAAILETDERPREGSGTVLVVDDEELLRDMAAEMLSELGYETLSCGSGDEAVELYQRQGRGIDIVLLDMVLPGITGADAFRQLRRVDPKVRVVLCSGAERTRDVDDLLDEGAVDFVQKPFDITVLASVLAGAGAGGASEREGDT